MESIEYQQIVELLQKGRLNGINKLLGPLLRKSVDILMRKYGFKKVDAEEIARNAAIDALLKIETFDNSKGAFSTWLISIIINAGIDVLRKGYIYSDSLDEKREKGFYIKSWDSRNGIDSPTPSQITFELYAGISELSNDDQKIIDFVLKNYSGPEAAKELNITPAAFRKRKERALTRLKEILITMPYFQRMAEKYPVSTSTKLD